jgi:DNA-directed RNA polymerase specialized sigma24 family protein
MEPSRFARQHREDLEAPRVDATVFRQGWRIVTRLDGLLADGAISLAAWSAAVVFRQTWELAMTLPQRGPPLMVQRGSGTPGGAALTRLDAVSRLRRMADALGPFHCRLLQAHVVQDLSWSEMARQHHVDRMTVRRWTIRALDRLAGWPG